MTAVSVTATDTAMTGLADRVELALRCARLAIHYSALAYGSTEVSRVLGDATVLLDTAHALITAPATGRRPASDAAAAVTDTEQRDAAALAFRYGWSAAMLTDHLWWDIHSPAGIPEQTRAAAVGAVADSGDLFRQALECLALMPAKLAGSRRIPRQRPPSVGSPQEHRLRAPLERRTR
ncbi:hypothetical protein ACN27G_28755 [Plantactinospora sp. WMMB334]|uniref:hypothetical protein n=1 Tax=Plantactinospora sp. WMMB334 TaxID=3404119 RepID=UPI003B94D77D